MNRRTSKKNNEVENMRVLRNSEGFAENRNKSKLSAANFKEEQSMITGTEIDFVLVIV